MQNKSRSLQNKIFADNLIKQIQFKESYFAFKFNKYKKWKISTSGKIEKMWINARMKKFIINEVNIQEVFNVGFSNSDYVNLSRFLRNNMKQKFVDLTIARIEYFGCCMANIWFEKYYNKFKKIKENLMEIANQPELLFYPYYLKFLTTVRYSIIKNMTNLVIPSVISFSLMDYEKPVNLSNEIRRSKNTIKVAFSNVKKDSEEYFEKINHQITELYFKFNNESFEDDNVKKTLLAEIDVKEVFQKEFSKFQFQKSCKFLKISPRMTMERAFLKYQDRLTRAEVDDIVLGNTNRTDDFKKAWQIYIKYRNENSI
ncbi:hypothetical protein [Spiroplasma endosymbiont of Panorpa germanica]|uniref:hypothetical protein n=1 Tax=Spiroplasma endosymbiont of Panorpa germanica TaxID=3066314 RepID=UPI0030D13CC5